MTDGPKHRPDEAGTHGRAVQWMLTDDDRAAIRAAVAALPPLTNDQVDALCEVIIAARNRRRRETVEYRHDPRAEADHSDVPDVP